MPIRRPASLAALSAAAVLVIQSAAPTTASAQCQSQESFKLAASDVHAGDELGRSVDVSGTVAVAGAPRKDIGIGAAYVYEWDGADWRTVAKLTASGGVMGDEFGYAVAVSGDVVVVGARQPSPAEMPGLVYVFERPAGGWADMTETARLTASDGAANDNFGAAVDIDGTTIVVGAYLDDDAGDNSGAAFVFERPAGSWTDMTEAGKLTADDANALDQFGIAVSISGDTVVVGADRDSDVISQAGSAYVFARPGGAWTNMVDTAKLTVSTPVDFDRFGLSVAVSGDTAVVGAWGDDTAANKAGAAYVFAMPGGGWVDANETATLTASDAVAGIHLGWSVSIDGDVIAAGAPANLFDGFGARCRVPLPEAGGRVGQCDRGCDGRHQRRPGERRVRFGCLSRRQPAPRRCPLP